jgi:hypothetical protein
MLRNFFPLTCAQRNTKDTLLLNIPQHHRVVPGIILIYNAAHPITNPSGPSEAIEHDK